MEAKIKVITYEQSRLEYFTNLMKHTQKTYNRLFKKFKDAPCISAGAIALSDAGAEVQFLCDVVEMLEKGYCKQEWISVEDKLPENGQMVLIYDGNAYQWKPTISCAIFQKGKTKEQLKEEGYKTMSGADEYGNNKKPYRWCSGNSPMNWHGQMVTHWMPLPETPKMKGGDE